MIQYKEIDPTAKDAPDEAPRVHGARVESFAVFSRRRLVGYVYRDQQSVERTEGDRAGVAVALASMAAGKTTKLFGTKREAALRVASDVSFRS